ncbi:hypothetical protein GCM10009754_58530 [Amycolatopsis minnesotensis]|uniref:Uncharacterized protein n=1 Tax=Amycolatopsis minnesotensis TaxID=337894 RepID=A0ABN2RV22_9PSEU
MGEWDAVKGAFGAWAGGGPYRARLVGIAGAVMVAVTAPVAVMVVIRGLPLANTLFARGMAGFTMPWLVNKQIRRAQRDRSSSGGARPYFPLAGRPRPGGTDD